MITPKVNPFYAECKMKVLHMVTRYILQIIRWVGIFPVSGLKESSDAKLRFILKSPYTVFCIATVLGQAIVAFMTLFHFLCHELSVRNFYKVVNNGTGVVSTIIILLLARRWPRVVDEAAAIERSLPKFGLRSLVTACNVVSSLTFLASAVDYVLSNTFYLKIALDCYESNLLLDSYFKYTMPWAHDITSLTVFMFFQILDFQVQFLSSFMDVFIVITSLYLTSYFEELNNMIVIYKDKNPNMWAVLRLQYTKLMRLVKLVDDSISPLVLCSFSSNLAMIISQVFKILRKNLAHNLSKCPYDKIDEILGSSERIAFFTFSVLFKLTRFLMTSVLAARLHSTARELVITLYEVPMSNYTDEVQRFSEQILRSKVALSGLNFFCVTRKTILTMAATLVTYELLLLQFSESAFQEIGIND